jgi:hypothetical protein
MKKDLEIAEAFVARQLEAVIIEEHQSFEMTEELEQEFNPDFADPI